jgi:hypothetical protein
MQPHMENMHWPLTILSKAVHFKNLTGASAHVGLSQPQLSRLISQLEKEFDVSLLDRSTKRKSAWTPAAHRLAEVYTASARKLQTSIHEVIAAQIPSQIHIGALEGLSEIAMHIAHDLLANSRINEVELNIYDQNDLEEKFFNGDLDLIFTSRTPGKQKFKHVCELGFQSLDQIENDSPFTVLSGYEYGVLKKKPENKLLVSNSLSVRRHWLNHFGGTGILPSHVKKAKGKDLLPVLIIASELFNEGLWRDIFRSTQNQSSQA